MRLKKRIKRRIALLLAMVCTMSVVGCGEQEPVAADPTNAIAIPDYSDSDARMDMYCYIGPSPGEYTNEAGEFVIIEGQRTVENFQKYKDCGFDTLMLMGNDKYTGEDFETSDLKRNLDMAQEVGLKVIVFDNRIYKMGEKTDSVIGDGKDFASMDELVKWVKECMSPYMNHPAFYGISLRDEPWYYHLKSLSEVIQAIHTVDPEIFTHTVLHPYAYWGTAEMYTEKSFGEVTDDSYRQYVGTFLDWSGEKIINYDNYPFTWDGMLSSYYLNMQIAVNEAAKREASVTLSVQASNSNDLRDVEEDDLRFQGYSALGLGVKSFCYYTYQLFPSRAGSQTTQAIVSDDNTSILYDDVQKVNAELQELAKVMLHFDYEKAYFTYDKENSITAPTLFAGLENEEVDGAEIVSVTQPTMLSQLKDSEKNLRGYMVMNSSDTAENLSNKVSVKFEGYDYATIYVKGVPETVGLTESVLTLTLEPGEGIFVIPHK
jgi:hypothetical protein